MSKTEAKVFVSPNGIVSINASDLVKSSQFRKHAEAYKKWKTQCMNTSTRIQRMPVGE